MGLSGADTDEVHLFNDQKDADSHDWTMKNERHRSEYSRSQLT